MTLFFLQVVMNKHGTPLLREYSPFSAQAIEGKAVHGPGHGLYMVKEGQKRIFPDYDTFCVSGRLAHAPTHPPVHPSDGPTE